MSTLTKQFAVVFFLGFIVGAAALGLGGMSGQILSPNANLVALRYLGSGLMIGGLALWIAMRRAEGGKPGLNTLLGMLVVLGAIFLIIGAIFPVGTIDLVGPAGLAATISALVVGFLAMLISPASGAKPLATHWPEGGEVMAVAHGTTSEHHETSASGESGTAHSH